MIIFTENVQLEMINSSPLKELVCLMHQSGLNLENKKPLWELKWEMPVQGRGCPGQGTAEKSEGSEGSSG